MVGSGGIADIYGGCFLRYLQAGDGIVTFLYGTIFGLTISIPIHWLIDYALERIDDWIENREKKG
jgi:hypothetical protein